MNPLDQVRLIHPGWRDVLEIAVVAYALYRVLLLLHGTRALQIALGIALLFASYAAAWFLKLGLVTYLLGIIFTYGAFALLVVFQPELRAALARLGQARLGRFFRRMEAGEVADAIVEAVERLSRSGIGAIVAPERETPGISAHACANPTSSARAGVSRSIPELSGRGAYRSAATM